MKKVRIKNLPLKTEGFKEKSVAPNNRSFWKDRTYDMYSNPDISVRTSLDPVPREDSNMEAEKGETVFGDINGDTLPEFFKIGGKRHSQGGTPLDLPPASFVYSDTKSLKIKDPFLLKMFGKPDKKKGFTPADISKAYDINNYRKMLQDPDSDKIQKETAEMMITNYNMKLGKLALVQESMKGFPNGIPQVAIPYITTYGIDPASLVGSPQSSGKRRVKIQKCGGQYMQAGGSVQEQPAQEDPMQTSYTTLQSLLTDPNNQKLRDEIYADYKQKVPNSTMTQDEVITNFLEAQKQIYAIQSTHNNDPSFMGSKEWDKGGKDKNRVYNETASSLGFTPLSEDQIKSFQAVYQSLQDLSAEEEFQPMLGNFQFGMGAIGQNDQTRKGEAISPIDGIFGNTTVGQMVISAQAPAPTVAEETPAEPAPGPVPGVIEEQQRPIAPSQWWAQDVVKTAGAFKDLNRIKKYMPWGQPFQPQVPTPTFYDPTRELAANAEQANIGTQGLTAFAGPQAFNARFSQIQGTGARQAADTLGRYNNLNVGQANQSETQRAGILNEAANLNRMNAQDIYDKTQIVNQQFDNAKNMARQELRKSYIDAITNRANAQVMNQLYPQYNISPITGGMMTFVGGKDLKPEYPDQKTVMDTASEFMHQYPGFTPQQYYDAAKTSMGMATPNYGYMPDTEFLQNYAAMLAGAGFGQ